MRYYISDLHFSHARINEVDKRGFQNSHDMDEYMIARWNSRVTNEDEVYVIGDFSWAKGLDTWKIFNRLNGKITLIEGNHDFYYLDDPDFVDGRLEEVLSYLEEYDGDKNVILSHYPMPFYNRQFHKDADGNALTYMLYGHVHNTFDEYLLNEFINQASKQERINASEQVVQTPFYMINVFCVFSDYVPLTLEEWMEVDTKRREFINAQGVMDYEKWDALNEEIVKKSKKGWME